MRDIIIKRCLGELAEWFKALVLKTSDPVRDRGFESLILRIEFFTQDDHLFKVVILCQSGRDSSVKLNTHFM